MIREEIDQQAKTYINDFLRDSNEYPLLDNYKRKQLIRRDLFKVEKTFSDGAEWGIKFATEKIINWLERGGYFINNTETIEDLKRDIYGSEVF